MKFEGINNRENQEVETEVPSQYLDQNIIYGPSGPKKVNIQINNVLETYNFDGNAFTYERFDDTSKGSTEKPLPCRSEDLGSLIGNMPISLSEIFGLASEVEVRTKLQGRGIEVTHVSYQPTDGKHHR